MSKVLRAVLSGIALLLLIYGNVYADGSLFGHGEEDQLSTIVIVGTSGLVTSLSTSNRVLGYSVTATVSAGVVGIYDGATFITEGGCLVGDMRTVWFPFPRNITVKLEVMVNASTTIVTIYYE